MTFLVEFSNIFEDNVTDRKISKISTKYCSISRGRSLRKIKFPVEVNLVTHSHLCSVNNLSHSIPMSQNRFKWLIWWIIRVFFISESHFHEEFSRIINKRRNDDFNGLIVRSMDQQRIICRWIYESNLDISSLMNSRSVS